MDTGGTNTTSYTVWGLAPNSYHCYHIYAFNDYGNSAWTDWACAVTLPPCDGELLDFEQTVTGAVDDTTQFPQSGYYRLEATRYGSSQGDYALRLEAGREAGVGDINCDCDVDTIDLGILAELWESTDPNADLNLDGSVNQPDYDIMNANWHRTCDASAIEQQKQEKVSP